MVGNFTKLRRLWACLLIAGVSLAVTLPWRAVATAGIVQPPHLSRIQSAKPPEGFRDFCIRYVWACTNRAGGRITSAMEISNFARNTGSRVNGNMRRASEEVLPGEFGY